jgi:hypothetical protein
VLLGERLRVDPAERQPRAVDAGGVGEKLQHVPIVPVSMRHVEQLLT